MQIEMDQKQEVADLASLMMHKHYCENDVETLIAQMDEDIVWFGAADHEYAIGKSTVAGIFRQFAGQVPLCNLSEEHYHVLLLAPDVYLCSGQLWIATDPSTGISLQVHQRVTFVFRRREGAFFCCHIHISNPYGEMVEEDVGFPTKMAWQTYYYLQEQAETQKRQIGEQTELLRRMSYEDSLTGLYNRNKFKQLMDTGTFGPGCRLGVACFDLNGLKAVNDRQGHSAGDELICRAADQLRQIFAGRIYRIGGDEFVVVDDTLAEEEFHAAVHAARKALEEERISCAVGASWRSSDCGIKVQFDEADRLMYEDKRRFHTARWSGRGSER